MAYSVRFDFTGIYTVVPMNTFWDAPTKPQEARILLPNGGAPEDEPPEFKAAKQSPTKHCAFIRTKGRNAWIDADGGGEPVTLKGMSDVIRYLDFETLSFHPTMPEPEPPPPTPPPPDLPPSRRPPFTYVYDPLAPPGAGSLSLLFQLDEMLSFGRTKVSPNAIAPTTNNSPSRSIARVDGGKLFVTALDTREWKVRYWNGTTVRRQVPTVVSLLFEGVEDFSFKLTRYDESATQEIFIRAEADRTAVVHVANLCGSCNVLGWGDAREPTKDEDFRLHYYVLDDRTMAHIRDVIKAGEVDMPLPEPCDPEPGSGGDGGNCLGGGTPPYP